MSLLAKCYEIDEGDLDKHHAQHTAEMLEESISLMVKEREARLIREVRDELGKHGVATGDYGPLNRFCEMI